MKLSINGKVEFSLNSTVESFLSATLGKGWKHDNLINAVQSWYNDRKTTEETSKHGSVTDKAKQGKVVGREQITRTTELVRNDVGQFAAWHDSVEKASDKLSKLGCMVTVTQFPDGAAWINWINKFAAKQEPKAKKPAKAPKAETTSEPIAA